MEISAGAGIVILVKEVHMVRHGEQQGASRVRRGAIIVERFVLVVTFILCKNVHINLLISYLVTFDASYRKCLSFHFVCSCNINCVFLLMCDIDIHPLLGASDFSGNVMVTCYYHTCCRERLMKMCGCHYCSVFLHHLLSSFFVQFLYSLRRRIGDNPLVPDFSKFIYLDKEYTSGGR
jgi:hypothetical protein